MRTEKVLIVEDEPVIAVLLKKILFELGIIQVEIELNFSRAQKKVLSDGYDLIIMDINLGDDKDGIDLIAEAQLLDRKTPFIYVSGCFDFKTVTKAKHTKPFGYLVKPIKEIDLQIMIELLFFRKEEEESVSEGLSCLSERERQVFRLLVDGFSNKMIADELFIAEKTVAGHRAKIMKKLRVNNVAELVRKAYI